jgi:hypothetical protein
MKDRSVIVRVKTFNVERFIARRNRIFRRVCMSLFIMFITVEIGYYVMSLLGILD